MNRWREALLSPRMRLLQREADAAWRMVMAQTRRIARLTNTHYWDQKQISFLKAELVRVVGERSEANAEIERLKAELATARRTQDLDERRAARYRLAWVSCQSRTRRIRENASG